jgi:hypothetical protein
VPNLPGISDADNMHATDYLYDAVAANYRMRLLVSFDPPAYAFVRVRSSSFEDSLQRFHACLSSQRGENTRPGLMRTVGVWYDKLCADRSATADGEWSVVIVQLTRDLRTTDQRRVHCREGR